MDPRSKFMLPNSATKDCQISLAGSARPESQESVFSQTAQCTAASAKMTFWANYQTTLLNYYHTLLPVKRPDA